LRRHIIKTAYNKRKIAVPHEGEPPRALLHKAGIAAKQFILQKKKYSLPPLWTEAPRTTHIPQL
jgi:hypothetical protein